MSRVAFSDEHRFKLYFNDCRMHLYRRRGERYFDVNVNEHGRYEGGSVMVWAAPLQFIAGNLNSQRYDDEVMRSMVLPFLRQIGQRTKTTTPERTMDALLMSLYGLITLTK